MREEFREKKTCYETFAMFPLPKLLSLFFCAWKCLHSSGHRKKTFFLSETKLYHTTYMAILCFQCSDIWSWKDPFASGNVLSVMAGLALIKWILIIHCCGSHLTLYLCTQKLLVIHIISGSQWNLFSVATLQNSHQWCLYFGLCIFDNKDVILPLDKKKIMFTRLSTLWCPDTGFALQHCNLVGAEFWKRSFRMVVHILAGIWSISHVSMWQFCHF